MLAKTLFLIPALGIAVRTAATAPAPVETLAPCYKHAQTITPSSDLDGRNYLLAPFLMPLYTRMISRHPDIVRLEFDWEEVR